MENPSGILASRFTILLGTMERPKVVRDIVLRCVVLQNLLKTQERATERAADDIAAVQNEQVVYVPDDNYRNPSSEAKNQQDLLRLLQSSWLGRMTGSEM